MSDFEMDQLEIENKEDFVYNCVNPDSPQDGLPCANTCDSLAACDACNCVVQSTETASGPWGDFMDVFMCLLPILLLIYTTIKKSNPWPTTVSLPAAAATMYVIRTAYLGLDPLVTTASVWLGLLEAWTPLSIMAGAIFLFQSMEATLCMPYMMRELQALTAGHAVATLMLVFSFCYMVEGASGFGTPVALAAPMLVRTGQPAMESVVVLLVFNTFATVWGAVGTPLWFGLGSSPAVSEDDLVEISYKAALALAVPAFIVVPVLLTILVPVNTVRANLVFVLSSLAVTIGPSVAIACFNFEFPSLVGGLMGCILVACLVKFRVGLVMADMDDREDEANDGETNGAMEKDDDDDKAKEEGAQQQETPMDDDEENNNNGDEGEEMVLGNSSGDGVPPSQKNDDEEIDAANKKTTGYDTTTDDDTAVLMIDQVFHQDQHHHASIHDSMTADGAAAAANNNSDDDRLLGPRKSWAEGYLRESILRTFPLWGVVLLLVLTRVEQIGIKEHLTKQEPYFSIHFGTLGTFRLSSSIVFQMRNILTYPNLNWKYELLYIPFLIPFVLVSILTMILFRHDLQCHPAEIVGSVAQRLKSPAIALLGALSLVQLILKQDNAAPAYILGTILSDWFQQAFVVISPLLGALGSFFSGSTTVSNLTFGEIQDIAAESVGTSRTTMLALQSVGASAGNGICLNNIIAACAVVGLTGSTGEGQILMRTYKYVLSTTTIATVVMLAFFFRFE